MESGLKGLAREVCIIYLDDIMVMGSTFQEHMSNLSDVLGRLRDISLRLKLLKCCFAQNWMEYLGYLVIDEGIAADSKKVQGIQAFPVPSNLISIGPMYIKPHAAVMTKFSQIMIAPT